MVSYFLESRNCSLRMRLDEFIYVHFGCTLSIKRAENQCATQVSVVIRLYGDAFIKIAQSIRQFALFITRPAAKCPQVPIVTFASFYPSGAICFGGNIIAKL